jgi:hypothetical protein
MSNRLYGSKDFEIGNPIWQLPNRIYSLGNKLDVQVYYTMPRNSKPMQQREVVFMQDDGCRDNLATTKWKCLHNLLLF